MQNVMDIKKEIDPKNCNIWGLGLAQKSHQITRLENPSSNFYKEDLLPRIIR